VPKSESALAWVDQHLDLHPRVDPEDGLLGASKEADDPHGTMMCEFVRKIEGRAGYPAASADVVHHEGDSGVGGGCPASLQVSRDVCP